MSRLEHIASELKDHAPFTAFGAVVGVVVMGIVSLTKLAQGVSQDTFHVLHPAHLLLSSIVTSAVYRRHERNLGATMAVGFVGSVGICSISDVVMPYVGGALLGGSMTFHLCILEHPWLTVPAALVGAAIGTFVLRLTKCPHAAHVLISTLASLFYLMAFGVADWLPRFPLVFVLLFLAVWIPCCTSDVVFPHLFTKRTDHR